MPRYRVHGADRQTGQDLWKDVDADTPADASAHVASKMLVSDVQIVADNPSVIVRSGSGNTMLWLMAISLLIWCIGLSINVAGITGEISALRSEAARLEQKLRYVESLAENADKHAHKHNYP